MSDDKHDETGDHRASGTGMMRRVSEKQKIEAVRRELEDKRESEARERLERTVYAQREELKKAKETINELDRRMIKVEQAAGLGKWAAGVITTSIIGLIIAALAGA